MGRMGWWFFEVIAEFSGKCFLQHHMCTCPMLSISHCHWIYELYTGDFDRILESGASVGILWERFLFLFFFFGFSQVDE